MSRNLQVPEMTIIITFVVCPSLCRATFDDEESDGQPLNCISVVSNWFYSISSTFSIYYIRQILNEVG